MNKIRGHIKKIYFVAVLAISSPIFAAHSLQESIQLLKNKETRSQAFKEIEERGPAVVPHLKKILHDPQENEETWIAAHLALGKSGDTSVHLVLEECLLKDEGALERESSAIALGHLGDKQSVIHLKKATHDSSGNVRMRAIWALAKLGDKTGKQQAVEAIASPDVTEQVLAIEALEAIGDKSVIPQLKEKYNHPNPFTQINAKLAVTRLESKELKGQARLNYMTKTLKRPEYELQRWATEELAKMAFPEEREENPKIVELLKKVAKDEKHPGAHAAWKELQILAAEGKLKELQ